jgi:hypothetical protein
MVAISTPVYLPWSLPPNSKAGTKREGRWEGSKGGGEGRTVGTSRWKIKQWGNGRDEKIVYKEVVDIFCCWQELPVT